MASNNSKSPGNEFSCSTIFNNITSIGSTSESDNSVKKNNIVTNFELAYFNDEDREWCGNFPEEDDFFLVKFDHQTTIAQNLESFENFLNPPEYEVEVVPGRRGKKKAESNNTKKNGSDLLLSIKGGNGLSRKVLKGMQQINGRIKSPGKRSKPDTKVEKDQIQEKPATYYYTYENNVFKRLKKEPPDTLEKMLDEDDESSSDIDICELTPMDIARETSSESQHYISTCENIPVIQVIDGMLLSQPFYGFPKL